MVRIAEVHLLPRHVIGVIRERQDAEERQPQREAADALENRFRPDVEFHDRQLAVHHFGAHLLEAAEHASVAIAHPAAEDALNVDLGHAPGIRSTIARRSQSSSTLIGVSSTSKHPDEAWDFLQWTLSDDTQTEIVAKNKDVVARTDLADNKYSSQDPRVVLSNQLVGKGVTPISLNFGATYNDPTGPWLKVARDAVFGNDVSKALADGKQTLTASLSQ